MTMITSAEEFVRLRSSQDPEEYRLAAWGEATDEIWLEVIENFPDYAEWVAHNKSISLNIVKVLATHPDWRVRSRIAEKRKTPPDILWELAKDANETVRSCVVNNAKTPQEIVEFLLDDSWETIKERAQQRLTKINTPEGKKY
jgi:hypothetical protein